MQQHMKLSDPSRINFKFPCIKARQPIGDLYIASLPFNILCAIADFDVRRVMQDERDVEKYLGIQRPLNPKRVREIEEFVNFSDASFPGSIIIAVDERSVSYDDQEKTMVLSNVIEGDDPIMARHIARVIDGQHRIAGLYKFRFETFDCPVTILVGADISDQAQMFSRVNIHQTKVNASLAYDLYELSLARSPQKTCHEITVALDREPDGPFCQRIKRLGTATPGRDRELLTQATIVRGLMAHISLSPDKDRDWLLRGRKLAAPSQAEAERLTFRRWFVADEDELIFDAVSAYFSAVRGRWEKAWNEPEQGYILPRTNGYFALMRFLRDAYNYWRPNNTIVTVEQHRELLDRVDLKSEDLTTENFDPGTSGEAKFYKMLRDQAIAGQPLPF
jgi:DGQHR domain-containing protein